MESLIRLAKKLVRFVVSVFIMLLCMVAAATAKPTLHHDLVVRLNPEAHHLDAVDRIDVDRIKGERLIFILAAHLTINSVTLDDNNTGFRFREGRLAIPLPPHKTGGRLVIAYEGVFNDAVDAEPLNTDNPGYGVTGTIQPQGALLLAGSGWYPHSPEMDATYALTVDAPMGMLAVTAGNSLGHTITNGRSLSRWGVDNPLEGLSLAAGAWKKTTKTFGGVTAATYFSNPLQHLSPDYLGAVGRYLDFYEARFGPYPFKQFAVVENFFPTGYGFPSYTLLGRRVLQLPFIIHTSLGHEIAHCWWGNGVLVDASLGNWSEGLTTYVSDYLFKEHQGVGIAHRRQWLRNYASLVDHKNNMAVSDFISRTDPATKTIGYDKAAMVFHMLRRTVGEEVFWQTLREVYARYRFKAISWRHWQLAFEQAGGRPLERFFDQWVYRAGAPSLTLSQVTVTPAPSGFAVQGQIVQTRPYYDFNIDVDLQTKAQNLRHSLSVSGARTPFTWQVAAPLQQLVLDPDVHLFRRLASTELPATINAVRGRNAVSMVVAEDLDDRWLDIGRRMAAALGLGDAVVRKEAQFSKQQLAGSDLIWIGHPRRSRWLFEKQDHWSIKEDQLKLSGQWFSRKARSFFMVVDHPRSKERVMAFFLPQSIDQAAMLCAKIPHYGKYSYLVFKGGRNQVKGNWPVKASPLTVQWPQHALGSKK